MLKVNKVGYLYMFSIVITTKTVTEEEKVLVAKHLHCSPINADQSQLQEL